MRICLIACWVGFVFFSPLMIGTYDTPMLKKFSLPTLCLSCTRASTNGADSMSLDMS